MTKPENNKTDSPKSELPVSKVKIKFPTIVKVMKFLIERYDLRLNKITNQVEGRKKGQDDFAIINENDLYIELLANGYRISLGNLCALLYSEFVPKFNAISGINLIVLRTISSDISEQSLTVRLGFIST